MTMMTQLELQDLWRKYAVRLENDADPDVVRADYDEELARLSGIHVNGRGGLPPDVAKPIVDLLKDKGCAVLDDPAREGEDAALVLFLPEEARIDTNLPPRPQGQNGPSGHGRPSGLGPR